MPQTIFFSWQADTAPLVSRNLIERALKTALDRIGADTALEEAERDIEIDRDTKGVTGSPPIVDTIFKKIDAATVFLPDLTFVGHRLDGRPTPNPNVLIEYGWALKSLGHSFMLPVMNTAFGEPTSENMPFDMRHLRYPIRFCCPEDADEPTRKAARSKLSSQLEEAIRAILKVRVQQAPAPIEPQKFQRRETVDRPGRFRRPGEAIGISDGSFGPTNEVRLTEDPTTWLRVMPEYTLNKSWSVSELQKASTSHSMMQPLNQAWRNLNYVRGPDGFGIYPPCGPKDEPTLGLSYIFKTGEIWSIDTSWCAITNNDGSKFIYINESFFANSLEQYSELLSKLEVPPPFRWIAGVEGVRGRGLYLPRRKGYSYFGNGLRGQCMVDQVIVEGLYTPGDDPILALKPFFEAVYESVGLERPAWLDVQRSDDD